MRVLLWIWQLFQNILGLTLVAVTNAVAMSRTIDGETVIYYVARRFNHTWSGVSLGNYIVFSVDAFADETSVRHEHGHQIQSLYFGPLYLLVVGLPSIVRNIYDRFAHYDWTYLQRVYWYYNSWPENQADRFGNVHR